MDFLGGITKFCGGGWFALYALLAVCKRDDDFTLKCITHLIWYYRPFSSKIDIRVLFQCEFFLRAYEWVAVVANHAKYKSKSTVIIKSHNHINAYLMYDTLYDVMTCKIIAYLQILCQYKRTKLSWRNVFATAMGLKATNKIT